MAVRLAENSVAEPPRTISVRIRVSGHDRPYFKITGATKRDRLERTELVREIVAVLVEAGKPEAALELGRRVGTATTAMELGGVRKDVKVALGGDNSAPARLDEMTTFEQFALKWTSGELHTMYRQRIRKKKTAWQDAQTIRKWVAPHIGKLPLHEITTEQCEDVLNRVDSKLSEATVHHVAQAMSRVFKLAVYPAKLVDRSPVPPGFIPPIRHRKAKTYLYPAEDKKLLACKDIYLVIRLLYGVLDREGLRVDEALSLDWCDLDLVHGAINLDQNKTADPRTWALDPSVLEALRIWKRYYHPRPLTTTPVFVYPVESRAAGKRVTKSSVDAEEFRLNLKDAMCDRAQLFDRTEERQPIRIHDLRATFVTLALAQGKSETWVADRTGHRSSSMINRYRRLARSHSELRLGGLAPICDAIPELKAHKDELDADRKALEDAIKARKDSAAE